MKVGRKVLLIAASVPLLDAPRRLEEMQLLHMDGELELIQQYIQVCLIIWKDMIAIRDSELSKLG